MGKRIDVDVSWINCSSKTQAQVVGKAQTCRAASIDLYIYIYLIDGRLVLWVGADG